jgi:curli production assembly/transport component CsgF
MSNTGFRIACLVGTISFLSPALTPVFTPALATEQVYHPISPALGGNPSNGTFLLSTAQAQGEGVNSGNNGPTINFPSNFTPTTPTTPSTSGTNGTGATSQTFRRSVANPLGTNSGMP